MKALRPAAPWDWCLVPFPNGRLSVSRLLRCGSSWLLRTSEEHKGSPQFFRAQNNGTEAEKTEPRGGFMILPGAGGMNPVPNGVCLGG
ncbi:hypothetical protein GN956_G9698 [Arapaima gigas]